MPAGQWSRRGRHGSRAPTPGGVAAACHRRRHRPAPLLAKAMPFSTAEPPRALVAGFAGCRCRGMSLAGLADGVDTVVAGGTAANDAGVVHRGAGKRHGALVAGLAGQRGRDLRGRLAQGGAAVMARGPVAQPSTMSFRSMLQPSNDTVLLWQVSQGAVVGMCFAGLPRAVLPLWHVAQPPAMPVWFMLAPTNDTVLLWQVSQPAVVAMCFAGLPKAVLPLWQEAQTLTEPG